MSYAGFKHAVRHPDSNQRGAAFVVMLVVLVLGVSAILIGSLNSLAAKNGRDAKAADALAQAREALIGYAVSDENRPGEMPCPDIDNDGSSILGVEYPGGAGFPCASLIGRLPWKTLGLPDLRDAAGERLWYAVSDPFHAGDDAVLNSDTTGTISVSGNLVANNVIAIVFSPGRPLPPINQVRSAANENTYSHYLESVLVSPTSFQQLTQNDNSNGSYTYNDHMLLITYNDVMPLVEYRIVREVKTCLDEFASMNPRQNYPWAAKISENDYFSYYNASYILFGRIPTRPNVFQAANDPDALGFIDRLNVLQIALNNYEDSNTSATRNALDDAGDELADFADGVGSPITSGTADNGEDAGDLAQDLAQDPPTSTVIAVQNKIDAALNGLISSGLISHSASNASGYSLPTYWSNCPILADPNNGYDPSDYWYDWRSLLFYQVANNCRAYGVTCSAGGGDLTVTGSGNPYPSGNTSRAAVILSRKIIGAQARPSTTTSNYLESTNIQVETDTTPNAFLTYKSTDANFATVNDIVMCVDGYHSSAVVNPAANCR
ncbi:MAG: hypothetical protein V1879_08350 [Pseudomonadota bacterium]